MRYLRTNTATIVTVGPFLDKTDGVTLETALTITNERISFTVDLNDGSAPTLVLDNVTGATSGTSNDLNYITNCDAGLMQLELAAANVNYLGRAFLTITDAANHCPVFHEFMILPAMVFDSLIAGTDVLQADMTQILGTAVSAPATAGILDVNLKNIANAAVSVSTAQLGVNVVQISGDATAADNAEAFFDGTGYAGTNNVIPTVTTTATTTNLTNLPAAAALEATLTAMKGATFSGATDSLEALRDRGDAAWTTATGFATAANLATLAGYVDTEVASILAAVDTEVAAILADTNELQTDLVNGGRLDLLIDAIKAKTDNLPSDPADQSAVEAAITAATSPLATAANLATLAGYVDTEVASILAAVDTEVAAILADTNELQTDLVNGGRIDLLIDAIKAKTDTIPASPAAVGSAMTLTAAYDAAKTAATQTSVDDLPTNAELATALAGADDATLAAIAALNNLSSAQAQTAATAALNAYDPPTNAEMEARTLVAASYFDPAADTVARVTLVDTTTTNTDMVAAASSVGEIADAVWDEVLAGHAGAGSTGAALTAAGAAGDPWSAALPGAYGAGTAGKLLSDTATAVAVGGTYSYTNTIDDNSGNLLDGVAVELATDSAFANVVCKTHTNALGAFTVYNDVAGTHYLRLQLSGYSFTIQTVTLA